MLSLGLSLDIVYINSPRSLANAAESIWCGLGSVNNWSDGANWIGNNAPVNNNSLIFAGSTRLNPTNNISALVVNNITFRTGAAAFSIGGTAFTQLNSSYIVNYSNNSQTISNNIALSTGTDGGTVNCNGAAIVLNGVISGSNGLIKTGPYVLTLTAINTYGGGTVVNAGTVKIGSSRSLGASQLTLAPDTVLDLNSYALRNSLINAELADIVSDVSSKIINSGPDMLSSRPNCLSPKTGTIFAQIDDTAIGGGTISLRLGHTGSDTTLANVNNKIRGKVILTGSSTTTVANMNADSFGTGDLECGNQATTQTLIYNGSINSDIGTRDIGLTNNSTGSGGGLIIRNNGSGLLVINGVYAFNGTVTKQLTLGGINTGDNTVKGIIRNATTNGIISVVKTGDGKWILSGANTYTGSTSITSGDLVVVKATSDLASEATATFTPTQLSVAFSPPLTAATAVQFFKGPTTQSYSQVSLVDAEGFSGTYNSTNSTLTLNQINLILQSKAYTADGTILLEDSGNAIPDYWAANNRSIAQVTLKSQLDTIGPGAFYNCTSLANITIHNNISNIGDRAFEGSGLTNITIPNKVAIIKTRTFSNCINLTNVTLSNNVTNIESSAFQYCAKLTNVVLGSGVRSIGNNAFSNCTLLPSITIPDGALSIGSLAFSHCSNLSSATIPSSVISIGNNAFSNCTLLPSITIPDGVTSIESYAFYNCSNLTNINILPSSMLSSIKNNAFASCIKLTNFTIPDGVTVIEYRAFTSCNSLTSMTIPENVATIEGHAFYYCTGLTNLTLGSKVANIGLYAFRGCTALRSINCLALIAPTLGNGVFQEVNATQIHVPIGATGYGTTFGGLTVVYSL